MPFHTAARGCTDPGSIRETLTQSTSLQEHAITWTVTNTGTEPMRSLLPQVDCRCRLVKDFPELIAPGESAVVTIRIAAPLAGHGRRQIPVYCASLQRTVGILEAEFDVPTEPPFWIDPPKLVRLQTTSGKPSLQVCVWECIEASGTKPHLTSVTLSPQVSDVGVSVTVKETAWGENGQLVKRGYNVQFQMEFDRAAIYNGLMKISTRGDEDAIVVPLFVNAKPQVSVFPSRLEFSEHDTADRFQIITVVHRVLPPCEVNVRSNCERVCIVRANRKMRRALSRSTA